MAAVPSTIVKEAGLRAGVPTELPDWRIALPCSVCGRYLTDPQSVMAGVGRQAAASHPDITVIARDGRVVVWDITPGPDAGEAS